MTAVNLQRIPEQARGLTAAEASRRLVEHGPNIIERQTKRNVLLMLAAQFASPMIWLLLGAAVLSGVLCELADAIAIAAIVTLNAVVGFFQELDSSSRTQVAS